MATPSEEVLEPNGYGDQGCQIAHRVYESFREFGSLASWASFCANRNIASWASFCTPLGASWGPSEGHHLGLIFQVRPERVQPIKTNGWNALDEHFQVRSEFFQVDLNRLNYPPCMKSYTPVTVSEFD